MSGPSSLFDDVVDQRIEIRRREMNIAHNNQGYRRSTMHSKSLSNACINQDLLEPNNQTVEPEV